jgi:hypothetical protein
MFSKTRPLSDEKAEVFTLRKTTPARLIFIIPDFPNRLSVSRNFYDTKNPLGLFLLSQAVSQATSLLEFGVLVGSFSTLELDTSRTENGVLLPGM